MSALSWLARFFGYPPVISISGSISDASVLIAWAYIIGLLIQGIAQSVVERAILAATGGFPSWRWLIDGGEGFTPEHREKVKDAIRDYFGEPVEPSIPNNINKKKALDLLRARYQEVFYQCFNLVEQKKLSDRPLAFNAHYGLFRALLTFMLMLLLAFGPALAFKWADVQQKQATGLFGCILALLIVATIISYFSMKKRGEDFAKSIYDLFYTFYRQEVMTKSR
jgi:hypothetical protein